MNIDFAIIGAQKSATTWITHALAEHRNIYLPKDEIPIFENGYNSEEYFTGLMSMYNKVNTEKVKGIKNTHLLFYKECPSIIFNRTPNIKLIATFRDPVDRAISSYYWHLRVGAIPLLEINEGLERIFELGENSKDWQTIFEPGFYAKQVKQFQKYFGNEQFHFILHEEIRSNPNQTIKNLYNFLGVDPDNTVENKQKSRPKEAIYSLTRIKWLSFRNPLILYKSPDDRRILWKNINEQSISKKIFNAVIVSFDRLILSKIIGNNKPKLNIDLENKISQLYSDDKKELEDIINKRISNWK